MSVDRADCDVLQAAIEHLDQRVQVLIQAVDELTDEIQWRNRQRNAGADRPEPFVLRSMSLDPSAEDWSVNRVPREQVAALRDQIVRNAAPGRLFD